MVTLAVLSAPVALLPVLCSSSSRLLPLLCRSSPRLRYPLPAPFPSRLFLHLVFVPLKFISVGARTSSGPVPCGVQPEYPRASRLRPATAAALPLLLPSPWRLWKLFSGGRHSLPRLRQLGYRFPGAYCLLPQLCASPSFQQLCCTQDALAFVR